MRHNDLTELLLKAGPSLARGPVAVMMAEDEVEIDSTVAHLAKLGFGAVILLVPKGAILPDALDARVHVATHDVFADGALAGAVNRVIDAAPGTWLHYCYNAEYLHFPFCETRTIRDLLIFHAEERREAMVTYVVDLYAGDLAKVDNAVSLEDAWLDRTGYYALDRKDAASNWTPRERQMDFFGGLRWRFEEHIPLARRKIDRVSLLRAKPGLRLLPDFTTNNDEMNTYACAWHHNLTAAVCSFRTAKALRTNPGSRHEIHTFRWPNSTRFTWTSQQLMDLGLMEPGQWF